MFVWDPQKAKINLEKHQISFEEASKIFSDNDALDWTDLTHLESEIRFKRIGRSFKFRLLIVVYALRTDHYGKEKIRIISAR